MKIFLTFGEHFLNTSKCVEKKVFPAFACLGACEQGAFHPLCSSFEQISESMILNITHIAKRGGFPVFATFSDFFF